MLDLVSIYTRVGVLTMLMLPFFSILDCLLPSKMCILRTAPQIVDSFQLMKPSYVFPSCSSFRQQRIASPNSHILGAQSTFNLLQESLVFKLGIDLDLIPSIFYYHNISSLKEIFCMSTNFVPAFLTFAIFEMQKF